MKTDIDCLKLHSMYQSVLFWHRLGLFQALDLVSVLEEKVEVTCVTISLSKIMTNGILHLPCFPSYPISSHFAAGKKGGCILLVFLRVGETWAFQTLSCCQFETLCPAVTFFWTVLLWTVYSLRAMGRSSLQIFSCDLWNSTLGFPVHPPYLAGRRLRVSRLGWAVGGFADTVRVRRHAVSQCWSVKNVLLCLGSVDNLLLLKQKCRKVFVIVLSSRKIKITWRLYCWLIKADVFWWGQLNPQLFAFISARSCHWPLAKLYCHALSKNFSPNESYARTSIYTSLCYSSD